FICFGAVLLRRHLASDRCQRDDGYGCAGAGLFAGPSVRRLDQKVEAKVSPSMTLELAKRIAFTLGALLVYRLGTYIPVPGIDSQALGQILNDHRGALTLRRISLFSLGLTPYFSAAIIVQLLALISSRFNAVARRGEAGRRR